jgi:hypothetical protein
MSTGGRTTNTMSEMLTNMLRDVSIAKTLPDADLEFLTNLEMTLLAKVREPTDQAAGQIPMGPDQGGAGAPPATVPGGAPLPPGAPPMPPGGQSMPGLPGGGMPQIDPATLQQIMAQQGGGPPPGPPGAPPMPMPMPPPA